MKIALIGAGLIGQSIAHLLRVTGDYDVVVFDRDAHALELLEAQGIPTRRVDSADDNRNGAQLLERVSFRQAFR